MYVYYTSCTYIVYRDLENTYTWWRIYVYHSTPFINYFLKPISDISECGKWHHKKGKHIYERRKKKYVWSYKPFFFLLSHYLYYLYVQYIWWIESTHVRTYFFLLKKIFLFSHFYYIFCMFVLWKTNKNTHTPEIMDIKTMHNVINIKVHIGKWKFSAFLNRRSEELHITAIVYKEMCSFKCFSFLLVLFFLFLFFHEQEQYTIWLRRFEWW